MAKTLTNEDLKEIGKVLEKCLKNLNQMEVAKTSELMNIEEIGKKLNLKDQSVYKLIKRDKINAFKIGKNIYVTKDDFNNYLNSKIQ